MGANDGEKAGAYMVELMEHALGVPRKPTRTYRNCYRNYFAASPGSPDHGHWLTLVGLGLAIGSRPGPQAPLDYFFVSDTGIAFLRSRARSRRKSKEGR